MFQSLKKPLWLEICEQRDGFKDARSPVIDGLQVRGLHFILGTKEARGMVWVGRLLDNSCCFEKIPLAAVWRMEPRRRIVLFPWLELGRC